MSGDETDRDYMPGKKCLAVKTMDWRNPSEDIKSLMRTLDQLHLSTRFGSDGVALPGIFPYLRLSSNRLEAQPKVPSGLPINFYNPLYLNKLSRFEYRNLNVLPTVDLTIAPWLLQFVSTSDSGSRYTTDIPTELHTGLAE